MSQALRPDKNGVWLPVPDGYYEVALGNCTQWPMEVRAFNGLLLLWLGGSCKRWRACVFSAPPTWKSLQRRFGKSRVRYEGDARHLADFIASQLGTPGYQIQGDYTRHPDLLRTEETK